MPMRKFKNEKFNSLPPINRTFKAEATSEDSSKLTIYGDIGESWWGDSIAAKDIEKELKNITSSNLNVHINSYGGDVFDGIAIYNLLKNHSSKIIVHVDGIAASAASLIAMAGDEIIMNTGAMLMIHEASTFAWGTKTDIQKTLNALDGIDKSIADIYMTRFTGERSEIETMIVNETWFTSSEAVDAGLADGVDEVSSNDNEEVLDPEEFKNSVLARLRKQPVEQETLAASANHNINILNKFKRQ